MIWPFIHKTNPRRQIDPIECGAVALGMVLEYFGHYETNAQLRVDAKVSRSGSSASSIIAASAKYGLDAVAKKIMPAELSTIKGPAILFMDQCHFVVYEGYFLGRHYINDPARGRYTLDRATMRKRFSKIAITFSKTSAFKIIKPSSPMTPGSPKIAIFLILLGVCSALAWAMLAAVMGFFLSRSHTASPPLFIMTGALLLWGALSSWLLFKSLTRAASVLAREEVSLLERALLAIPYGFFHEIPFLIFANTYAGSSKRNLHLVTKQAKRYFFIPFVLALLVFVFAIWLPLGLIVGAVLFLVCIQGMLKRLFEKSDRSTSALSDQYENPSVDRALIQAEDMRAMGQEQLLIRGFLERTLSGLRMRSSTSLVSSFWLSFVLPLFLLLFALCFFTSHLLARGALLWSEMFSVVIVIFAMAYACARGFARNNEFDHREHQAFKQELAHVVNERPTKIERAVTTNVMALRDVSFRYGGDQRDVLTGLNISLNKGKVFGLVGSPLVGKSTLLSILGQKIFPTDGEVVHYVSDEPFLRIAMIDDDADVFHGTLQENLTLFESGIPESDLVSALTKACAVDLFYNRPMGLLTPIFSRGKNLSTGEKKRLLLAQALVQNPDVIVLDNFFEALDEFTAATILRNLHDPNRAVVFTSFRNNELALCTDVWLMSEHGVFESTHETLILSNEHYRTIVRAGDEGMFS